jgi:signal transduction histidine kinase
VKQIAQYQDGRLELQEVPCPTPPPGGVLVRTTHSVISAGTERMKVEQELLVFRVIQELINNIIKHSNAGFIHLTQNANANFIYIRLHHDGKGIVQAEFDKLNQLSQGLGLKNIASRMKVLNGRILFELDNSHTYYKVTLEIPKDHVI